MHLSPTSKLGYLSFNVLLVLCDIDIALYLAHSCSKCTPSEQNTGSFCEYLFNYADFLFGRMNGALSHMEEFQEAFNCPANSKMNADTKCHLF